MIDYLKQLLASEEAKLKHLEQFTRSFPVRDQFRAYWAGRVDAYREMIYLLENS